MNASKLTYYNKVKLCLVSETPYKTLTCTVWLFAPFHKPACILQDLPMLEIRAKKIVMRDSKWKMYWTPAAPKWDMAPTYVKRVLFPDYHGAENVSKSLASTPLDDTLVNDVSCLEAVKKREETERPRCHSQLTFFKFQI